MTEEKGLDLNVADRIEEYVKLKDQLLLSNNNAKAGLNDMVLIFKYLKVFGVSDKIFLARGLDYYYTGIIYEAVTEQSGPPNEDELDETTVGVALLLQVGAMIISWTCLPVIKRQHTMCWCLHSLCNGLADGLLENRMKICSELWNAGINVCNYDQIPFVVIINCDELNHGEVRIKDMRSKKQGEDGGVS
ncbi:16103_t:CDS:2 [Cetraspora pellucida]|uniref:16103_t:CDS:1 n=1 Tax=Cetraspora pellucida TaxID=1433469 RepID=A0A9N9AEL2_9GLOM|nr:16103_t:CDS:2 [Cetraspora pellucida]